MVLINVVDENGDWFEALSLWNRVVNWSHYQTSDRALTAEIKALLVLLWNEKDWLKAAYPSHSGEIERFASNSTHLCVVADVANTAKHRVLTRKRRSAATQTDFFGRITIGGSARKLHFVQVEHEKHREIIEILRCSRSRLFPRP